MSGHKREAIEDSTIRTAKDEGETGNSGASAAELTVELRVLLCLGGEELDKFYYTSLVNQKTCLDIVFGFLQEIHTTMRSIHPNSLLVELEFNSEKDVVEFVRNYKDGSIKKRFSQEFLNLGIKEVTVELKEDSKQTSSHSFNYMEISMLELSFNMAGHIRVVKNESTPEEVSIDIPIDATIALSTIQSLFNDATGLKYKNKETGQWTMIRLVDGVLFLPEGDYGNALYVVERSHGSGSLPGCSRHSQCLKKRTVIGCPCKENDLLCGSHCKCGTKNASCKNKAEPDAETGPNANVADDQENLVGAEPDAETGRNANRPGPNANVADESKSLPE